MKNRSRIIFAAAIALVSSATFWAQSPLLTNPANLSQFPSVERVRTATKGSDEVDSHARFMAALYKINDMIIRDLVQAPNGGEYDLPRAADTVHSQYSNAITRYSIDQQPPASHDPRFRGLEDKYEKDPAFFDSLLTQFFSPKFRTDYYAWIRKPVPQQTAGSGGGSGKSASLDTSIAKAKAFKMDTTVFGLELGQPLSLPTCSTELFSMKVEPTCVSDPDAMLANPLIGMVIESLGLPTGPDIKKDPLSVDVSISLDPDHCPSWAASCQVNGLLYNGQLVAIAMSTNGRKVENSVNAELRQKYGPPTMTKEGKITPDVGNAFDVHEPIWMGKGIRVEYQVVVHNEDIGVDTRTGWLRVITETAYERIVNKPIKRKL